MATAVFASPQESDTSRRRRRGAPASDADTKAPTPWYSREGIYFVPTPELSDEIEREINARQCRGTWEAFWNALHDNKRRGPTQAIRHAASIGILDDVGVMGLHRRSGLSPKTIRRHLTILVEMGLLGVVRPAVSTFTISPNGRLHKAKGHGREKAIRIVALDTSTFQRSAVAKAAAEAKAAAKSAASYGEPLPTPDSALMGSHSLPSTDVSKDFRHAGETDGVGFPSAGAEAPGLTAGKAPRTTSTRKAAPQRQDGRPRHQPTQEAPEGPTAAERAARWHQRDPAQEQRVREYREAQARKRAEAEARRAGAVSTRAADVVEDDDPPTIPIPGADLLEQLIEQRRRGDQDRRSDGFRSAWKAEHAVALG